MCTKSKGERINKLLVYCKAKELLNIQFKPLFLQEPSRVALKTSVRCSKRALPPCDELGGYSSKTVLTLRYISLVSRIKTPELPQV